MMDLSSFYRLLREKIASSSGLAEVLNIESALLNAADLKKELINHDDINAEVEHQNYFSGDWPAFNDVIASYLTVVRDVQPEDLSTSYAQVEKYFSDLQIAFTNRNGAVLVQVVVRTASAITSLAISLDNYDAASGNFLMLRTNALGKILLKMFNSIRADRFSEDTSLDVNKKDCILHIATLLCRCYFKIEQIPACANVFSNIHTANISFSRYPRSQRVLYRYYLGRFYFYRQELMRARQHLLWAFNNCHSGSKRNQDLILTYLIPTNLLLGVCPKSDLYSIVGRSQLAEVFVPLEKAIEVGNFYSYHEHLIRHFEWLTSKRMFLLLRSKADIIIYRNLFNHIDKIVSSEKSTSSASTKRPHDLSFDLLFRGIQVSMKAGEDHLNVSTGNYNKPPVIPYSELPEMLWDYADVENVCVSLIDEGFMKGNIYTRSRLLRLMPSGGFPSISQVWSARSTIGGTEDDWLER
ncbi:hypothetical protein V1511DRAFT_495133 [Dipodascopsis uninucleata]